jgi:hypothetical protein
MQQSCWWQIDKFVCGTGGSGLCLMLRAEKRARRALLESSEFCPIRVFEFKVPLLSPTQQKGPDTSLTRPSAEAASKLQFR